MLSIGRFPSQQISSREEIIVEPTNSNKETIEPVNQMSSLNKIKKKLVPSRFNRKKHNQGVNDPADDDTMSVDRDDSDGFSIATHKITNVSESFEDEIEMTICSDEEELSRDGSYQTESRILQNNPSTENSVSNLSNRSKKSNYYVLREAPSVEVAAYRGPPRFDWIDIETAAAIRVQAAYRRFKSNKELDRQGLTTAGMRKRRNNKRSNNDSYWNFLFNPSIFSLSTTNEKSSQENTYYTKRKEREEREADLRKFHMKKKSSDVLIEEIEIVEDFSTA